MDNIHEFVETLAFIRENHSEFGLTALHVNEEHNSLSICMDRSVMGSANCTFDELEEVISLLGLDSSKVDIHASTENHYTGESADCALVLDVRVKVPEASKGL